MLGKAYEESNHLRKACKPIITPVGRRCSSMPRPPNLGDLKRRIHIRLPVFLIGLAVLLVVDEYVKEGYLFDFRDVVIVGTHEFAVVVFLLLSPISYFLAKHLIKQK
ncbi:hypothetical protein DRP05_13500 [Archaeoglobales archaeon]|nr:MAG: hypothetical protein DRP05_13500 [Archaeoglobales archaeon]